MRVNKRQYLNTKKQWLTAIEAGDSAFDYQSYTLNYGGEVIQEPLNHADDFKDVFLHVTLPPHIFNESVTFIPYSILNQENLLSSKSRGVEEVIHILSAFKALKSENSPDLYTNNSVLVSAENKLYFTIAKLRVLRFFMNQIKGGLKGEHSFEIGLDLTTETTVHPLIPLSVFAFTAQTGGADFITSSRSIIGKDKLEALTYVLKHESNIHEDIWKGSFAMEKLCNSMARLVAEKLGFQLGSEFIEYGELSKTLSGTQPFLRGPYSSMYLTKPWTIRQYAGFSTAEASNEFYKSNLAQGQKGLSVAFDLPTHRGYDSDHPEVYGDVGKAGVAIDTVEDMQRLFEGIPLEDVSVSMTMNGAVLPVMAFYIVAAEEQGVTQEQLKGTLQNDILKEFMVRNTYIYPPQPSMKIVKDIISYCAANLPKFNPISISGYHMHEAGASTEQEVAFTLADGLEYVRLCLSTGLSIDDFAQRLSFFWGTGMNFIDEVAKMRAARVLWSELMEQFNPKDPKSHMLRVHCQTSGWSLIAQNPTNNIVRTTLEALAAVSGHTQSLHTNALDEAIALPTPETAKIARDTQLYLQEEIGFCDVIDPFGGSEIIESRTNELIEKCKEIISEIEQMGGMTKAIQAYYPQSFIERNAAKRQAAIDAGEEVVVGLNKYRVDDNEKLTILEVDNEQVKLDQVKKLKEIKGKRDGQKVHELLQKLEMAARNGKENLLAICVDAARARVTLGEMSYALEKVFGRYQAKTQIRKGLYASKMNEQKIENIRSLAKKFRKQEGRQPRILVAKMGQDGHDRGAKVIASAFADMGFDVDLGSLFLSPQQVVKQAIESDVHIIGVSSLAGGHKSHVKELMKELKKQQSDDVMVIVGGIIPEQDYEALKQMGVAFIFGPGTDITKAAEDILQKLLL